MAAEQTAKLFPRPNAQLWRSSYTVAVPASEAGLTAAELYTALVTLMELKCVASRHALPRTRTCKDVRVADLEHAVLCMYVRELQVR